MKLLLRSLVLTVYASSASVNAASFDCAKASSQIDNAVCASVKVSELDSELADIYSLVVLKSSDVDGLKIAQRSWLKTTRNVCPDEACLIKVYEQRIDALKSSLPRESKDPVMNTEMENKPPVAPVAELEAKKLYEEAPVIVKNNVETTTKKDRNLTIEVVNEKEKKQVERAELFKSIGILVSVLMVIVLFIYFLIKFKRYAARKVLKPLNKIKETVSTSMAEVTLPAKAEMARIAVPIDKSISQMKSEKPLNKIKNTISTSMAEVTLSAKAEIARITVPIDKSISQMKTEKPKLNRVGIVGFVVFVLAIIGSVSGAKNNACENAYMNKFSNMQNNIKFPRLIERVESRSDGFSYVIISVEQSLVFASQAIGDQEKKYQRAMQMQYESSMDRYWECKLKSKFPFGYDLIDLYSVSVDYVTEFDKRNK
jgi:uncharacterized protein